ncbi:E3 ubiquitin-protein ligase SIAH1 [Manduca sexta]|uniref:E3 ubiquitin-protein ligase n=1 Tax=Manduca sexta TaxID=7130 RepID=A0A922CH05_MANSE|nr:E3 ubiquitin-protein ligase SIAH1 [Manduca sexta]KAG6445897.1 hypothetical protein O3G_MSEX004163 [Manduca sexta]KAG6445898.1 hypothetical protein O3G_MSEX004163 [Manduca sexta]
MAAKANKKMTGAVDLPECPVCLETMSAPIFQCQSGHSLCNQCTSNLVPPMCPICRQHMTQMRNWQLEDIIAKAKVACPNKSVGCVYTMPSTDVNDHLKECIFRDMECPLGSVSGKCSWSGKLKDIMDHFQERHQKNCNVSSDTPVNLDNIELKEDERFLYLVAQQKMLFIITVKLDTLQKMAFWIVQHIGSKSVARQHIYEIHLTSNLDERRKLVFCDHCFNDAIKADEVFRQGKCAVVPFEALKHFIKDKKITFKFFIKRLPVANKKKVDNGKDAKPNDNKQNPAPKGPGPKKGPKDATGPPKPGPGGKPKQNKANA